jgi:hypothetical protein
LARDRDASLDALADAANLTAVGCKPKVVLVLVLVLG